MEEKEERKLTITGGDFNARTKKRGVGVLEKEVEREQERRKRRSKDRKINREGRMLIEFIKERD